MPQPQTRPRVGCGPGAENAVLGARAGGRCPQPCSGEAPFTHPRGAPPREAWQAFGAARRARLDKRRSGTLRRPRNPTVRHDCAGSSTGHARPTAPMTRPRLPKPLCTPGGAGPVEVLTTVAQGALGRTVTGQWGGRWRVSGVSGGPGLRRRGHPDGCRSPAVFPGPGAAGDQFGLKTPIWHLAAPLRLIRASHVISGAPRDSASATYWAS